MTCDLRCRESISDAGAARVKAQDRKEFARLNRRKTEFCKSRVRQEWKKRLEKWPGMRLQGVLEDMAIG